MSRERAFAPTPTEPNDLALRANRVGIVWNLGPIADLDRRITLAAKIFLCANRQYLCGSRRFRLKSFTKINARGCILPPPLL
jgi:hypothetical protein